MKCTVCGGDLVSAPNPPEDAVRWALKKRWYFGGLFLLISVATAFAGVVAFAMFSTVMVWAVGGFQSREMFGSTSPDGRYRITIGKRAEFPANEFLDPSIIVDVTLSDARSGQTLDYISVGLWEDGDFGKPKADWTEGIVSIRDLDDRHGLAVTMNSKAWEAR